ncbi:hypothetical protein Egran_06558, partial [Elaphomyces granulatus]
TYSIIEISHRTETLDHVREICCPDFATWRLRHEWAATNTSSIPVGTSVPTSAFKSPLSRLMLTQSLYSVTRYDVSAGRLILEHGYPTNLKRPATVPVDINLLLETIKANEIQVGSWLNVLGYVREQAPQQNDSRALVPEAGGSIYIEAVMVFSAGAIHVGDYERILRDSLEVDRRVNKPA